MLNMHTNFDTPYGYREAVRAFMSDDRPARRSCLYINNKYTRVLYLASNMTRVYNPWTQCADAWMYEHFWYFQDADGRHYVCRQEVNTYDKYSEKVTGVNEFNTCESMIFDQEIIEKLNARLRA